MRAADAWAIEEQGVPSLDLMERAGAGLARVAARRGAARADPRGVRQGQQRRRRPGGGAAAARGGPRGRRARDGAARRARGRRARPTSSACPGEPPEPFEPARLEGSGAVVDALLGTGFEGEPREPAAGAIAAINDAGRAGGGLRRALGRQRLDRRGRGRGGRGRRHRHLPRPQDRPARGARRRARRARSRSSRSASRAGRPAASAPGLISERVLELFPRARARGHQVRVGGRGRGGRLAGPDRRAGHGRAVGPARRRRLRAGRGAGARCSRRSTCGCSSR